jgi:uncharacterized protein YkwD
MRRTFCGLILGLIALSTLAANAPRTGTQAGDPGTLIAEVNGLRAARALAPYKVNNALMATAQPDSQGLVSQGALAQTKSGPDYLLVFIVVLALSGLLLILLGSALKRPP